LKSDQPQSTTPAHINYCRITSPNLRSVGCASSIPATLSASDANASAHQQIQPSLPFSLPQDQLPQCKTNSAKGVQRNVDAFDLARRSKSLSALLTTTINRSPPPERTNSSRPVNIRTTHSSRTHSSTSPSRRRARISRQCRYPPIQRGPQGTTFSPSVRKCRQHSPHFIAQPRGNTAGLSPLKHGTSSSPTVKTIGSLQQIVPETGPAHSSPTQRRPAPRLQQNSALKAKLLAAGGRP